MAIMATAAAAASETLKRDSREESMSSRALRHYIVLLSVSVEIGSLLVRI